MVIVPIRWLLDNGYWTSHDIPRWLDHDLTDTIYSFIGGSCGRRRHVFVPIGNLLTCRWWARVENWWVNECEMDDGWAGRDHFLKMVVGMGARQQGNGMLYFKKAGEYKGDAGGIWWIPVPGWDGGMGVKVIIHCLKIETRQVKSLRAGVGWRIWCVDSWTSSFSIKKLLISCYIPCHWWRDTDQPVPAMFFIACTPQGMMSAKKLWRRSNRTFSVVESVTGRTWPGEMHEAPWWINTVQGMLWCAMMRWNHIVLGFGADGLEWLEPTILFRYFASKVSLNILRAGENQAENHQSVFTPRLVAGCATHLITDGQPGFSLRSRRDAHLKLQTKRTFSPPKKKPESPWCLEHWQRKNIREKSGTSQNVWENQQESTMQELGGSSLERWEFIFPIHSLRGAKHLRFEFPNHMIQ